MSEYTYVPDAPFFFQKTAVLDCISRLTFEEYRTPIKAFVYFLHALTDLIFALPANQMPDRMTP